MSDQTPWSQATTALRWGKWVLGALALNSYNALIETVFWSIAAVIALAVIADQVRTRWLLHRWADHCQSVADAWVAGHDPDPSAATVTALPAPDTRRDAA